MSRDAMVFLLNSDMLFSATLVDLDGAPVIGATVLCTIQKRGTNLDGSLMAPPISWPVTLVENDPGIYEYTFGEDLPVSKGDYLKANTTATKGATVRYAEGVIIVKVDEH